MKAILETRQTEKLARNSKLSIEDYHHRKWAAMVRANLHTQPDTFWKMSQGRDKVQAANHRDIQQLMELLIYTEPNILV